MSHRYDFKRVLIDNYLILQLYDIYFVGLERLENLHNATADIRTGWYRQNSNETYTPYSSAFWMQPLPTQPSDINISDVTAAMYAGGFNGIFPVDPDKYYVFATGMLCQCGRLILPVIKNKVCLSACFRSITGDCHDNCRSTIRNNISIKCLICWPITATVIRCIRP